MDLVSLGMALYLPTLPTAAAIAGLVPRAVLVGGDPPATIVLRVGDKRLQIGVRTAASEVAAQAKGIVGYLAAVCGTREPALVDRVLAVRAILGVEIEPGLETTRAEEVIWELARGLDAIVFLRGAFHDGRGVALAQPVPRTGPVLDRDEAEPPGPPSAIRVADRLCSLLASVARGFLEREPDRTRAVSDLERLRNWVAGSKFEPELEPEERDILFEPTVGGLGTQPTIDAIWRVEGAIVLAWALGIADLPPHDRLVDVPALMQAIRIFHPPPPALLRPELRDEDEIFAMRERLFSIHWRLVDWRMRPQPIDFPAAAKKSKLGLVTDAAMLLGSDLAVHGAPIAKADPRAIAECSSIAKERHKAANWLVGDQYGPAYSSVGTDT